MGSRLHLLLLLVVAAVGHAAADASLDLLWQRAMALYDQQQWSASAALLEQVATAQTGDPPSLGHVDAALAAVYHHDNKLQLARVHYERALAARPNHAATNANLGFLLVDMGQRRLAIPYFERAIALDPWFEPHVAHQLALAYHYESDDVAAERLYDAVPVAARTAQYHYDRGVTLDQLGKVVEAVAAYNEALLLDQHLAIAWHNIATLHQKYGEPVDAIPNYLRALSIASSSPEVRLMSMTNLGIAYEMTDDVRSALLWYGRARGLAVEMAHTRNEDAVEELIALRVHEARAKRTACIWDDFEAAQDELQHHVRHVHLRHAQLPGILPFDSLLVRMDPSLRLAIARAHTDHIADATVAMFATVPSPPSAPTHPPAHPARLGVGYASYDYNDHPTAHLLEGVFAAHDRSAVQAVAFGYGKDDGSEFRVRLLQLVDEFVNLAGVDTNECVRVIRDRQLDILMDAQGHTRGGRGHITATRPAPIVVNYLVYPGTSGASYVDYVVADRLVTPPEWMATHLSEKLVLLPHSYQANFYPPAVVPRGRASLWQDDEDEDDDDDGAETFTFVNFNKIDKIEPSAFSLWMAILQRVPNSRLLLLNPVKNGTKRVSQFNQSFSSSTGDEIVRSLMLEAAARGVDGSRIAFVPRVTKRDHLRRHRRGGLFLDTLVYGAHSTATDALYAGLPVLTLAGDTFASRVGISLLHNVQLPQLITHSQKEFEDLAVAIATEHDVLLTRVRDRLRTPDDHTPRLFRTRDHVATLEAAQRVMATLHRRATAIDSPHTQRTAHIIVVA